MNIFYYPYKPEKLEEIRIILFLPNNDVVIISYPNLNFEHHRLLQAFLKDNKQFKKYIKLKISKYTLIDDLSVDMSKQNVATYINCSSDPYEIGCMLIPNSIKINQIDNILSFAYYFDSFLYPVDTRIIDIYGNVIQLKVTQNNDLYNYLNNLKELKTNDKSKRL